MNKTLITAFTAVLAAAFSTASAQVTFDNGSGDSRLINATNWSTDLLPTATNALTGTLDTSAIAPDSNSSEALTDFRLTITTGASVSMTGFGRVTINDSIINMNAGSWNTRGTRMSNTIFNLTGGTMSYNNRDGNFTNGSVFTVNGATAVYDPNQAMTLADATFTLEQGTVSDFNLTVNNAASVLNVNGGSFTATTFNTSAGVLNLGGSAAGTFNASNFTSGISIDWANGSQIAMTITGSAGWAESEYNAGRLLFEGDNNTALGLTWAQATSGGTQIWDFTGDTLTLVAIPEPSTFALLAGMLGFTWVMLRRR
jgi:hypothetical protein